MQSKPQARQRTLLCKYCNCGKCRKQIETLWTQDGRRVTGVPGRYIDPEYGDDHLRPLCLDCFWARMEDGEPWDDFTNMP